MALTPLDLQTLFVKMNDVNREQAHQRAAAAQEQAFEAKQLAEKEIQRDSSVNTMEDQADMDNRIKDDEQNRNEGQPEEGKGRKEPDEEKPEREYIKDPNLGKHIDLLG